MRQTYLPLGAPLRRDLGNFTEHGGSGQITESLKRYVSGEGMHQISSLYISGEKGVGKSHLLEGAYYFCLEYPVSVVHFTADNVDKVPFDNEIELLNSNHENGFVILVDDLDVLLKVDSWCALLMDWMDKVKNSKDSQRIRFVFATHKSPSLLEAVRPDIISRVAASLVWTIEVPSEDDLLKIMHRYAIERGFELENRSLKYLLSRCPRELTVLLDVINQVGDESLVERVKPSFSLVSRVVRNGKFE